MRNINLIEKNFHESFCLFKKNNFDDFPCLNTNLNDSLLMDSNTENIMFLNRESNIINNNNLEHFQTFFNTKNNKTIPIVNQNNKEMFLNLNSTFSGSDTKQIQDIQLRTLETKKRKKERRIFRIGKDNKGKGRIKKNSNFIGKHDKFSEDNIIRKVKGRFIEKIRKYINREYKKFLLNHRHKLKKANNLLQRITPKISRKIKRDENLKWFNSKLYNVFSEDVSIKCCLYSKDYNKKQIEKIYKENEAKSVIDILNKSIKIMYDIYSNNIKIPGLDTLNDDIKELEVKLRKENQEDINQYLKKYRKIAQNLEYIFIHKISRNNNK